MDVFCCNLKDNKYKKQPRKATNYVRNEKGPDTVQVSRPLEGGKSTQHLTTGIRNKRFKKFWHLL
jgi:hypothetical protein